MAIFLKIIEMKVWENFDGLIKLRKKAFVFHLHLIINKLNANLIKIKNPAITYRVLVHSNF